MDLLGVCNLALDLLGSKNIQTLDSTDKLATLCNKWGALTYNDILRTYRPNFATTTETLQFNVTTGGYQLPPDYVMIVSTSAQEYRIRNTTIYAIGVSETDLDTAGLTLEYISSDIKKLQYASDSFHTALSLSIAAKLAFPVTKEPLTANSLNKRAIESLKSYAYSDNQERRPSRFTKGLSSMSTWTIR